MRLKIKTYWVSQAKYNLGERKHSNKSKASPYIKNQANREVRRNAKAITQYELEATDEPRRHSL